MSPTSVASVIVTNARVARVEALLGILSVLVPVTVTRAQLGKPRTQGSQEGSFPFFTEVLSGEPAGA